MAYRTKAITEKKLKDMVGDELTEKVKAFFDLNPKKTTFKIKNGGNKMVIRRELDTWDKYHVSMI